MNNPDGTIRYGTYTLDLYDGPIFVEELDETKRNRSKLKVTIGRPGVDIAAQPVRRGRTTPPMPGARNLTLDKNNPLGSVGLAGPDKKKTPTPKQGGGLKTPKTPNSAKDAEKLQQVPKPKKKKKTPTPQEEEK